MHFKKEHFQQNKSILKSIFLDNYYRHSTLQLLSNSVLFILKSKFYGFLLLQSYPKNKNCQIYCIKLLIFEVVFLNYDANLIDVGFLRRQSSLTGQENTTPAPSGGASSGDLESLKQEILTEIRQEMNKMKSEIIAGKPTLFVVNPL